MSEDEAPSGPDWLWALERMRGAYAENTLRGWSDGFGRFERWCAARGLEPLPAAPEAVAGFVDELFLTHSLNTVLNRLYGIRMVSLALGCADPTRTETVRLAVRRGKRLFGVRARQAPAITAAVLARLLAVCGGDLRGLRDQAMLRVGYDSLCRGGELLSLRVEDVSVLADGTARVAVRKDKQDFAGDGVAYLSRRAVEALQAWLRRSGIRTGPMFRGVNGARLLQGPLSRAGLNRRIKTLALQAGLEPPLACRLCAHSLRVGAVQDLTVAGASLLQIMRAGRWRDAGQVAYYARQAPVNVWGQTEGDGYPLAARAQTWRRTRRAAKRRKGRVLVASR